jgi:hypothetical protein
VPPSPMRGKAFFCGATTTGEAKQKCSSRNISLRGSAVRSLPPHGGRCRAKARRMRVYAAGDLSVPHRAKKYTPT